MKATLTSKGQITIPVAVRRRLNLQTGDVLDFDNASPYLLARPDFSEKEMRAALGCTESRMQPSAEAWLQQTRGPVENPPEASS